MKKFLAVLLILAGLLSVLSACVKSDDDDTKVVWGESKDFTKKEMTITLTEDFKETTIQGFTVCYESADAYVFALREAFSLQQGLRDLSVDEYANLVRANNAANSPSAISHDDGLTFMEYSFFNEDQNLTYQYFTAMYKASDAFWMVQFSCTEAKYEDYRASFVEWAKSVTFAS